MAGQAGEVIVGWALGRCVAVEDGIIQVISRGPQRPVSAASWRVRIRYQDGDDIGIEDANAVVSDTDTAKPQQGHISFPLRSQSKSQARRNAESWHHKVSETLITLNYCVDLSLLLNLPSGCS